MTEFEQRFGNVLGNWVSAKIGMTPSVPFKQLTSVINYAENMPPHEWLGGFVRAVSEDLAKFSTTGKAPNFKYMWDNIPYLQDRFKGGYSEALQYAMDAAAGVPKAKNWHQAIKNFQTIGTRGGDIMAIVYGGKPYLDHLVKKGLSQKEATDKFLLDTLRSQQSPFSSTLSHFQNSKNPIAKAIFTFANTPSQYMRKMFEASQAYRHGDLTAGQVVKIYSIYGALNQMLYIGAGSLIASLMKGSDPDEDFWKQSLAQAITSFFGGIPFVRDIVNAAAKRAVGVHVYDSELPVFGELLKLIEYTDKAIRDEEKADKHMWNAGKIALELMGLSAANVEKLWKATGEREETVAATRSKKTDRELTEIAKTKKEIDAQLKGAKVSTFYIKSRKKQKDYRDSEAADNLKKAYSKAKREASGLSEAKKQRLLGEIDNSKANLAQTDYLYSDIERERKRIERFTEIYTK
jgi:hypothetical protein